MFAKSNWLVKELIRNDITANDTLSNNVNIFNRKWVGDVGNVKK
jgi:hypothetical protein